jgi:hypothetical protein
MLRVPGLLLLAVGVAAAASPVRNFATTIQLETAAETSANVSMGDLDGDRDLDLVLAKGRHDPLRDRVLLNDGKGRLSPPISGQPRTAPIPRRLPTSMAMATSMW